MRFGVAALLLVVVAVLLPVRPAFACSCAEATLEDVVAREPGAVAAVVRRVDDGRDRAIGTLAVVERLQGELPARVTVRLDDGASCRPSVAPGHVAALTFRPEGDGWAAVDCGMLDLGAALVTVTGPLTPDPEATGPPALVVAGSFPGAALATLDAELRVLGATAVDAWLDRLVPCGDVVVTVRRDDADWVVERRALPDLVVEETRRLAGRDGWELWAARCDADGRFQAVWSELDGPTSHIHPDLFSASDEPLVGPASSGAAFLGDHVWLLSSDHDGRRSRIATVDLREGSVAFRRAFEGLAASDLRASPDGRFVAVSGYAEEPLLFVLDAATATPVARTTGSWSVTGWTPDGRLALVDHSVEERGGTSVRLVDERLRAPLDVGVPYGWILAFAGDGAMVVGGDVELTVRRGDGSLHPSPDLRLAGAHQAVVLGEVRGPDEALAAPSPAPDGAEPAVAGDGPAAWQLAAATVATVAVVAALVVLRRRRAAAPR